MDPFVGYIDSGEHVFSTELDDILNTPWTEASNEVEEAKRIYVASILARFLHLCAACFDTNLSSEQSQFHCIQRLFESTAFRDDHETIPMHQLAAEEAIRIMQTSTSVPVLLMVYEVVLQYGEAFPSTYKSIQASASAVSFAGVRAFLHRLVHQIWAGSYAAQAEAKLGFMQQQQSSSSNNNNNNGKGLTSSSASKDIAIQISLREKAVRMLYEVCRVQKLEPAHLKAFDQRFIHHLFDLVEETRFHHDEDFNYRLIKLLVAINEQYMVVATAGAAAVPLNLVLNVLQQRLNASKTFGENLIFMLNRASSSDAEDVCMQLLVLKLLYLLFTTKETACYFYTNDLRVLVDIFIRELSDLPDESESLRHTYLRVLHPLLTNTQLCTYAYKRTQIRVLLQALVSHGHLRDISSTTRRLVDRCLKAEWCVELARLDGTSTTATVEPIGGGPSHEKQMLGGVTSEGLPVLLLVAEEATEAKQVSVTTNAGEPPPICASAISVPVRKRVVSLSNTPQSPQDIVVRPGSAAASLGGGRRTVSAQSAPCTPPRIATPVRQDSDAGSEFDDVTSISSSWHAHMAEDPSSLPAPRRRKPPQPPQLVARRALGESSISPTSEQRPASPLATAGASRRRPPPPPPAPRDDQDTDSNTGDTLCIADRLRRS